MTRGATAKGRQPNGASSIFHGKDGRWHGYVTVGTKDDGAPDRRHISRKTRPDVTKAVRELERQRDKGAVRKAGQNWTLETWLVHWVENIAAPNVSENTIDGYRVAVYHHLVPGLGAHRLEKLEPEHLERFYKKMQDNGSTAGTAHQTHRTVRTALNQAVRRGHLTVNPATIAKSPRVEEEEVEPYSVEEVQRLLDVIRVRRGRLRPRYQHGCGDRCGRKPGFCPQKINTRRETKNVKSRAGQRPIGVPGELMQLLRQHKEEQNRERKAARDLWTEKGYVFTSPTGEPLNPNTDFHRWKDLLKAAEVRDGRLHDARHTAATVLLILGVSDAVVDGIMGWEPGKSARMRRRYQHLTSRVLKDTADKLGGLLWGTDETVGSGAPEAAKSPVPAELMVHVARLGERRVAFLRREHADEVVAHWSEDWPDHTAEVEVWDPWRWEHQGPSGASAIRDRVPERAVVFHSRALFLPGGERTETGLPEQWSASAWEFETDRYTERASAWRTARRPGTGQEVEVQVRGTDKAAVEAAFAEACTQAVDRARYPGKYGDTDEW